MTEDCTIFNVRASNGEHLCPACGYGGYFDGSQFKETGGLIGTGICPCCLFEPGFDDNKVGGKPDDQSVWQAIRCYRERWLSGVVEWWGKPELRPAGWNGERQIERLFSEAPHLREH